MTRQGVAVHDDDPGVRVGGEDERQGREVRGRLHDPALGRSFGDPLERLQVALVPVVDRRLVHAAAPHRVVRHVVETRVHVARELVREGEDAFGREPAAVLVHGGEGGDDLVHEPDLVVAEITGGVVVGDGVQQLPQERRAVVGITGEQLVQERGARASEAGHHDRSGHGFAEHRRFLFPEVDHAQPVLQDQLEFAPGAEAAGQVEARFGVERGAQAPKRLLPPWITEVVEARGGDGGGGEILGLQRDHGASVVAEAVAERDHLVSPGAARRGDPGHGASPYPQPGENGRMESRLEGRRESRLENRLTNHPGNRLGMHR